MKSKNLLKIYFLRWFFCSLIISLSGCYSFVGGSLPEHLTTINIEPVEDNSSFGVPEFKDFMTNELIKQFKNDGTLKIEENNATSQLTVIITNISEVISQIGQGEFEKERKVQITCKVTFFDNVKKKIIWEKEFTNYNFYNVNDGFVGRNESIRTSIKNNSEDIVLSVISGW